MSSQFRPAARASAAALAAALVAVCGVSPAARGAAPFWRVATLTGDDLGCLRGRAETEVAIFACAAACAPIAWQLDERGADGLLVLDRGPEAAADDSPGVIDDNDELLWMVADSGRRAEARELPDGSCVLEIHVRTPTAESWAYAAALPPPAPRSPVRYVSYDEARDLVGGARVSLGFGAPTPRYLAVHQAGGALGPNLLDRLKVRARARFFGFIPLGRDEDDILWEFGAWRAGPIRVVRREYQWVRLGFGLRTPILRTESYVTRDFIELPVRLRLNYPPRYFFSGIEIAAALDFRGLHGWRVRAPAAAPGAVGTVGPEAARQLNRLPGDWIALEGPDVTLLLALRTGDSLATVTRTLLYRENDGGEDPEDAPGERPAIGYRLSEWGQVDRGEHWFAAVAYALPAGTDLDAFARERDLPVALTVRAR